MSKCKVSKEGKRFRDQYIIGKEYLPHIAYGLMLLRTHRIMHSISLRDIQELFDAEKFSFSAGTNLINDTHLSVGKGNFMMVRLNSVLGILPAEFGFMNAITRAFSYNCCYVQFKKRSTTVMTSNKSFVTESVELPTGLDIMELPDESLFQTQLCINNTFQDGAATMMGLYDADYNVGLGNIIYYGDSLLKIKRLDTAIMNVNNKLMELYKDK